MRDFAGQALATRLLPFGIQRFHGLLARWHVGHLDGFAFIFRNDTFIAQFSSPKYPMIR